MAACGSLGYAVAGWLVRIPQSQTLQIANSIETTKKNENERTDLKVGFETRSVLLVFFWMWILACLYCISHNSTKNFTTHLYISASCLRKFNRPMSNLEILTAFSQPCLVRSRDRVQQMTILGPRQGVL